MHLLNQRNELMPVTREDVEHYASAHGWTVLKFTEDKGCRIKEGGVTEEYLSVYLKVKHPSRTYTYTLMGSDGYEGALTWLQDITAQG